jgi:Helix-turn-helix domain
MNERTQYQQLQPEERQTIASLHLQGSSIRAMARILGRSPATVSRELTRNSSAVGYASVPAKTLSVARRSAGRRPAAGVALPKPVETQASSPTVASAPSGASESRGTTSMSAALMAVVLLAIACGAFVIRRTKSVRRNGEPTKHVRGKD